MIGSVRVITLDKQDSARSVIVYPQSVTIFSTGAANKVLSVELVPCTSWYFKFCLLFKNYTRIGSRPLVRSCVKIHLLGSLSLINYIILVFELYHEYRIEFV